MKISLLPTVFYSAALTLLISLSSPVFGDDDGDMLKQAEDLVHQAWAPGADTPPTDAQRTDFLTKALELAKNAPQHHVHRHRMKAVQLMKATLDEIKNGDPDKKVNGMLKDADSELREAISEAT
jgi:hypothetical protein